MKEPTWSTTSISYCDFQNECQWKNYRCPEGYGLSSKFLFFSSLTANLWFHSFYGQLGSSLHAGMLLCCDVPYFIAGISGYIIRSLNFDKHEQAYIIAALTNPGSTDTMPNLNVYSVVLIHQQTRHVSFLCFRVLGHQENPKLLKFYLILLNPLNSKLREISKKKVNDWTYSS